MEYLANIYQSITREERTSKHKIALTAEEKLENSQSNTSSFEELYTKAKTLRLTKSK